MNIHCCRLTWVFLSAAILFASCETKPSGETAVLSVVVDQDRQLAEQEQALLEARGALQRELTEIQDQQTLIVTKRVTLPDGDAESRAALEAQEAALSQRRHQAATQIAEIGHKLNQLLDEKSGLVGKAKNDIELKGLLVARREHGVAQRERALATRDVEIANREKALAEREQNFAVRQAKMCPQAVAAPPPVVINRPQSSKFSRRNVEETYEKAMKTMRQKGILTVDLPPGVDRLVGDARHAVAKEDYMRGKVAADQLLASVESMKVSREFISAKIGRLSETIRKHPPQKATQGEVNRLFQQATGDYGDGRFREANDRLNRIYGMLR